MSLMSNAELAINSLNAAEDDNAFGRTPADYLDCAQVYAQLATAEATQAVADAIREHTARTTHPAGSSR